MSKKAAQLAEQMSQMLEVIGALEARITELKKMAKRNAKKGKAAAAAAPEKPKRPPTAWIQFTQRVRGVLAAAGQPFPRVTDLMKFCADMRAQKGVDCSDAELLAARSGWEPPTAVAAVAAAVTVAVPVCPTCTGDISEDPEKHRPCVRSVAAAAQAAGADPMKAVDAWSEAVQSKPRAVAVATLAAGSRARTPLRRPSAPVHFSSLVAAEAAPGAALNTPSEEMVVEDI